MVLVFRNYEPVTNFIEGLYTTTKIEPESIQPYIKDKLELISDDTESKFDIKSLESRKVDIDLKKRLEKRMEKLEGETRRQIKKIIKDKSKGKKE